jgi:hypothetical protein
LKIASEETNATRHNQGCQKQCVRFNAFCPQAQNWNKSERTIRRIMFQVDDEGFDLPLNGSLHIPLPAEPSWRLQFRGRGPFAHARGLTNDIHFTPSAPNVFFKMTWPHKLSLAKNASMHRHREHSAKAKAKPESKGEARKKRRSPAIPRALHA